MPGHTRASSISDHNSAGSAFIYFMNKYFFHDYYLPGTVPGLEDRRQTSLCPCRANVVEDLGRYGQLKSWAGPVWPVKICTMNRKAL